MRALHILRVHTYIIHVLYSTISPYPLDAYKELTTTIYIDNTKTKRLNYKTRPSPKTLLGTSYFKYHNLFKLILRSYCLCLFNSPVEPNLSGIIWPASKDIYPVILFNVQDLFISLIFSTSLFWLPKPQRNLQI